ncbi:glycosyl transferase family 2 (plasmid) [Methanohalobium evestigatum Z-7303]|uniref:Glycosyl transferase family 2 n=1 Tax=Methanohalobium evestigatum (strain ATCC BAA-1072 / DSM 3721 / NBRC 107634 / OCM 161 / Z-7303) TaxID=644295 RepID=D7EBX7_METEZ|nr:glycosyltransferase family 2 protein [Methanohalobium evestigatum]ADI75099.1 glycosyl transferase family 2 [Methanohalobium evestigatum Z-7303]
MTFTIAAMPAYNEANTIGEVIHGCQKYVDKVVVVDDGSVDDTIKIAESLGAYVVRHPQNEGYGASLRDCFKTALKLDADMMVIIDSDGQHDPDEITHVLEPLDRGINVAIGSRFINGNGDDVPAYRKVGMKVLDVATNFVGGINVSDTQCGFRAYDKEAIKNIDIKGDDMSAGSEILLEVGNNKLSYEEVEVHCRYDIDDTSTQNPVRHGTMALVQILKDMEFRRPLYYFTAPGLLMGLVGVFLGLSFLQDFYHGDSLSFGPTLLMILLTLVGTFMAFTGIILHAMSKLIRETKRL